MSQADLIRKGQLLDRKNKLMMAVADAKASLQSLVNESIYAQGKAVEQIDTERLKAHLDRLMEKCSESRSLIRDIEELEY